MTKPSAHLSRGTGSWGAQDSLRLSLAFAASSTWKPVRRAIEFVFRHGVPPPAMIIPDAGGTPPQFPPLSALRHKDSPLSSPSVWDLLNGYPAPGERAGDDAR